MKILTMAVLAALCATGQAAGNDDAGWKQVVEAPEGNYSVGFDGAAKSFEVTKLDANAKVPAAVRLEVRRKNAAPVHLELKTIEAPARDPLRYTGHLDQWDASYMGVELQLSFDKKSWKKIGRFLGLRKK